MIRAKKCSFALCGSLCGHWRTAPLALRLHVLSGFPDGRGWTPAGVRSLRSCAPAQHRPLTFGDVRPGWGGRQQMCTGRFQGSPMVTVTHRKNPRGSVTLKFWTFKLYSRGATLTWLRDGDPVYLGTFGPGVTLPSGDGTYQTWMATRVLPGEEQSFTCLLRQQGENTTTPVFGEERGEPSASGSGSQGEEGPWV
ncbi:hereditary hemochromatosis protein homolog [Fukomys damarensis]|uniref:hereditary hemochromatosis protein homolog n=1 Tax=Fukomys damarensis TaxID=885580 RepID=UPI001455A2BD|nr:hereditary hemochromatosis protein homolog [Fukomys damarensis]